MGGGDEKEIMAANVDKTPEGEGNKGKQGDDEARAALRA